MQADLSTRGLLSNRPTDRSGRPRFCGHGRGCVDPDRPLPDRVYHCSKFAERCKEDAGLPRGGVHLPVYDHYCGWLMVCVYLDTIKPYLLLMVFLLLDAIVVFSCSIAALSLPNQTDSVLHGPMMVVAVIIVLLLTYYNVHVMSMALAMRNITIPEMNRLRGRRDDGFLFAIQTPTGDLIFERYRGNPWDLGWRNLYQVFGGWDCLLPFRQPPRCVGYGRNGRSDFEMTDEFWHWVEEKEEEYRLRAAGSQLAVTP